MKADVVIVGAGVLGISLAYHLSQRKITSIVLEREALPGSHASGKNAGMFRHLYRHPELTDWALRSKTLCPEEIKVQYFLKTGSIVVGRKSPGHHKSLFEEIKVAIPGQSPDKTLDAVFTQEDGLLDSGGYVNAIYRLTNKKFASILLNHEVNSVQRKSDLWVCETANNQRFSAPKLVNAAGAWLNNFLAAHHPELMLPAVPYARHLFVVHGWDPGFMPPRNCSYNCGYYWDETSGWYMRLWEHDSRLVSICDQIPADPDNFTPPPETPEHLAITLLRAFPEKEDELRLGKSWHCFRTYTDDHLPVWGEDARTKDLFWLGAYGGLGMSTSFAASYDPACFLSGENMRHLPDFSPTRSFLASAPKNTRESNKIA